ncbi:hypothetical protein [Streptomyces sp. NPDC053560]|uniref:hypothetical protein n=1 Tax=Streptomyces sp. NPDC053560 TaxID=3365711 RepID=UPI0037D7FE87
MLTKHRKTKAALPGSTRAKYRSEATAYVLAEHRVISLGWQPAPTPRLALRWLRIRSGHIADQLDHRTAQPLRHWATDDHEYERALTTLAGGSTYTFTISETAVRYRLTACLMDNYLPQTAAPGRRR